MEGRVYTKSFSLETRQYDLFGLDLGEGIPRTLLVAGGGLLLAWCGLMWLLLGPPTKATILLYATVPGLLIWFAFKASKRVTRRRVLVEWILWARFLTRGRKPIINLESREAHRREAPPLRDLLDLDWIISVVNPTMTPLEEWQTEIPEGTAARPRPPITTGGLIRLN